MKKINNLSKRIIAIMLLFLIIGLNNVSQASLISEIEKNTKKFMDEGQKTNINIDQVTEKFSGLGQVLTLIGTGIYVAVIAYMGIKYMTSNPESRAKLKVQLIGVLVSGIVIFGAYHIWSMALDIFGDF